MATNYDIGEWLINILETEMVPQVRYHADKWLENQLPHWWLEYREMESKAIIRGPRKLEIQFTIPYHTKKNGQCDTSPNTVVLSFPFKMENFEYNRGDFDHEQYKRI